MEDAENNIGCSWVDFVEDGRFRFVVVAGRLLLLDFVVCVVLLKTSQVDEVKAPSNKQQAPRDEGDQCQHRLIGHSPHRSIYLNWAYSHHIAGL